MSGKNNGTGQPLTFRCTRCRRQRADPSAGHINHVRLTGNTKDVMPSRWIRTGSRIGLTSREYECQDCGWVGWSRHIDLRYLERKNRRS